MRLVCAAVFFLSFVAPSPSAAQEAAALAPTEIPLSGTLREPTGEPRTGTLLLAIALYAEQDDPAPLWIEYQRVRLDANGHYDLRFGTTTDGGLPSFLFANERGRWIGVTIDGEVEEPRIRLLSVPYAAAAASADALGGRPAADFVLTEQLRSSVKEALLTPSVRDELGTLPGPTSAAISTVNTLAKFVDGTGTVGDSNVHEVGGKIGIGTVAPSNWLSIRVPDGNAVEPVFGLRKDNSTGAARIFTASIAPATPQLFMRTDWSASSPMKMTFGVGPSASHLTIGTTGNVGIGTDTPEQLLSVRAPDGDATQTIFSFRKDNAAGAGRLLFVTVNPVTPELFLRTDGSGMPAKLTLGVGGNSSHLTIDAAGNVGIGTANPAVRLHVAGAARISGDVTVDGNIGAKYQDVAEWVDASEPLTAGTVVIIDPARDNGVRRSTTSYDPRVAGAISPQPGIVLGEPGPSRVLVAQSGRVRVKADAAYGKINRGDLLVTSPRPGHAMRASPGKARSGTVLGKALEPLPVGTGEILVLLTLQ